MDLQPRINNPTAVSREEVDAILARGWSPTIQFVDAGASPRLLRQVNDLARRYGDRLEVRFYGHYTEVFDAAVLDHLPDVAWLSVDSLTRIRNEDRISRLRGLKRLSFGVYRFDRTDILEAFPLEQLTHLVVGETHHKSLDLAPLARARQLTDLTVCGHTRGLEVIAALPSLARLGLNGIPKRQDLTFLGAAPALKALSLVLGGRAGINELVHPGLEELTLIRVRGLETVGPLERFPALRSLVVEDQIQIGELDLTGASLERLVVLNCKTLAALPGLDSQARLREFRVARTRLDLDALLARAWPPSARVVGLFSGSRRWNERARAQLEARGLRPFEEPA